MVAGKAEGVGGGELGKGGFRLIVQALPGSRQRSLQGCLVAQAVRSPVLADLSEVGFVDGEAAEPVQLGARHRASSWSAARYCLAARRVAARSASRSSV